MEIYVLFALCLASTVRGIIVSHHTPLSYSLSAGYASQFVSHALPEQVAALPRQYSVHHPAEYTFASPPVRHAEPIKYPLPPAPVREEVTEPEPTAAPVLESRFFTYSYNAPAVYPTTTGQHGGNLLGVAYSPASVVSRMSFANGYGVSYGY